MEINRLEKDDAPETTLALQDWFAKKFDGRENLTITSMTRPSGAAGFSADTFILDLEWSEGGETRSERVVVRSEGSGSLCPESNYDNMLGLLKVIGDLPGLPVPRILFWEEDKSLIGGPFFAMEFVEGEVAADTPHFSTEGWVFEGTKELREQMYRSGIGFLADLHKIDWRKSGLEFLMRDGSAESETERHLHKLIAMYDETVDGKRSELAQRAISWLESNLPETENLCISWGDCRPGNFLWRDFKVAAALDWEMCGLADPALDVALWVYCDHMFTENAGNTRLPGMVEREEFKSMYEQLSGYTLPHFDYFEVFAAFRIMCILTDMIMTYEKAGQSMFGPESTAEDNLFTFSLAHLLDKIT